MRAMRRRIVFGLTVCFVGIAVGAVFFLRFAGKPGTPEDLRFISYPMVQKEVSEVDLSAYTEDGRKVKGITMVYRVSFNELLALAREHLPQKGYVEEPFPIDSWVYFEDTKGEGVSIIPGHRLSQQGQRLEGDYTSVVYYLPQ